MTMFITSYSHRLKLIPQFSKYFSRKFSIPNAKNAGTELALNHFDQFYSSVYENWPSIRLALLCPHNYCAVANVFSKNKTPQSLFGDLEVFNMRDAYYLELGDLSNFKSSVENDSQNTTEEEPKETNFNHQTEDYLDEKPDPIDTGSEFMPITEIKHRELDTEEFGNFYDPNIKYNAKLIKHGVIHYPEHLDIYYFPRGRFKKFPYPQTDITDLLTYYLMDGASILPVLALDIQKEDEVGDLCASPGGKSLAILFGLRFGKLVCNDASLSRVNKLKTVLNSYLPGTEDWSKKILVSNLDVRDWQCFDAFDKILLDVPCTNDRLSVMKDGNNMFQPKRFNERMQIPRIQTSMLCNALQALKVGGSLVYSTCSLSPIQNDGVVHMSLAKLSTESSSEFVIKDLTDAFAPLKSMFQFSDACRYGQLVVPFLPLNYGPMYICKITRNK